MNALRTHCAALALAALVAFAPVARAADISILGTWRIVEATPAPWSQPDQRAALDAAGKRALDAEVTFAKDSVTSKFKPLNCKRRVAYEANSVQVDALFDGNLPEPNPGAAAARMGFPKGDVSGVDVTCIDGQFTFHFRDRNTAMTNLDGVIYTLKRL